MTFEVLTVYHARYHQDHMTSNPYDRAISYYTFYNYSNTICANCHFWFNGKGTLSLILLIVLMEEKCFSLS